MITQAISWSDAGKFLPVDKQHLQVELDDLISNFEKYEETLHARQVEHGHKPSTGDYFLDLHAKKKAKIFNCILDEVKKLLTSGQWHLTGQKGSLAEPSRVMPSSVLMDVDLPPSPKGILRTYPQGTRLRGAENWFGVRLFPFPDPACALAKTPGAREAPVTQQTVEDKLSVRAGYMVTDMPFIHQMNEVIKGRRASTPNAAAKMVTSNSWGPSKIARLVRHYNEWLKALREAGIDQAKIQTRS